MTHPLALDRPGSHTADGLGTIDLTPHAETITFTVTCVGVDDDGIPYRAIVDVEFPFDCITEELGPVDCPECGHTVTMP